MHSLKYLTLSILNSTPEASRGNKENIYFYNEIQLQCATARKKSVIQSHHHHPHVVPQAKISLTFSRHFSLSFIASGRSSGPYPVYSHSCRMYVRAGRPAFARPYVGVHRSTSLMSSSLLLQQ